MKTIEQLIAKIDVISVQGNRNAEITSVCFDSRKACKGSLFVAVPGTVNDGHKFISTTVDSGTSAVVCEILPESLSADVVYIQVQDSAKALAHISAAFYDYPSQNIKVIGITGTNGKTTIATLLYRLFRLAGKKVGLLSTVVNYVDSKMFESTHTTPDPVQLQKLLSKMVENRCQFCFMEVSSHAVVQQRIEAIEFAGGVFTNLTHDHLDYHKTFENYSHAKQDFFNALPQHAFAITTTDDEYGAFMLEKTLAKKLTYGISGMPDYKGKLIESHLDGTLLSVNGVEVWTKLIGEFNVKNFLAIYATAMQLGMNEHDAMLVLSELNPVAGRFEYRKSENGITAIIDYAHTPDALKNVLATINAFSSKRNIITVVGAGGNRDKTKRPEMARVAAELSSRLILTSDNPRNENPEDILNDMKAGLDAVTIRKTLVITDRREAIKASVQFAEPGDIILIAGKGHETYQEIQGVKHHFDDREEITNIFNQM